MSIRPRKKNDTIISLNKAYQVVLNPLITEKATQLSEFNKMVFSVPLSASKFDIKLSIEMPHWPWTLTKAGKYGVR